MDSSEEEIRVKKRLLDKSKVRKKMNKTEIQLAIIKKKQCDANALAIVEQLLEPCVDQQWLLQHLQYINKSHLEDVIEERAISKLCGYVLCKNALTVVIKQQYHISTRSNKVYDVSRRKNFCSSLCYGAACYLLDQMFTSPLWLRDKEEIPMFQLLPLKHKGWKGTPGHEVDMGISHFDLDLEGDKKENGFSKKEGLTENDTIAESIKQINVTEEISILNISNHKAQVNASCGYTENECDGKEINHEKQVYDDNNASLNSISDYNPMVIQPTCNEKLTVLKKVQFDDLEIQEKCKLVKENNKGKTDLEKTVQDNILISTETECQGDPVNTKLRRNIKQCSVQQIPDSITHQKKTSESEYQTKLEGRRHKSNKEIEKHYKSAKQVDNKFFCLAMHVEQSVREWITKDTICLLTGEPDAKHELLEDIAQHERYLQLCKELNKIQLEEERKDSANLGKGALKPLPNISDLQDEGQKLVLKVRAFYQGNITVPLNTEDSKDQGNNDESNPVLPLTDAHAPRALRRRIFLDKLNKILPEILVTLAGKARLGASLQYTYNNDRCAVIKALVNSFSLSATNITFKTAEWTLVGLIIVKLLTIMDGHLRSLLATKQASAYISMILMSYKLDANYLDRLVIELTNNPNIFCTNSNIHC